MKLIDRINNLIEMGIEVKQKEYKVVNEPGLFMPDYISGEYYDLWMNKIKILADSTLSKHSLYDEIIKSYNSRNTNWGISAYDNMMGYLKTLKEDDELIEGHKIEAERVDCIKEKMLFISHATNDSEYVHALVELLEDIGFKSKSLLFCSSLPGYHIPTGQHIYDYLKEQFKKDLHVILILSDNYYKSPACLNEMGATWIKASNHTAILTPEFKYADINGTIDASKIWFKMDEKFRLEELKDKLIEEFELDDIDGVYWDRRLEKYFTRLSELKEKNKYNSNPQKVDIEDIEIYDDIMEIVTRFINNSDSALRCKNLSAHIKYGQNESLDVVIPRDELSKHILFGGENRRIKFLVKNDQFKGVNPADLKYHKWETKSSWTSNID